MHKYEEHLRATGKPVEHERMKVRLRALPSNLSVSDSFIMQEILAGLAAAEFTKLAETRGADAWESHKMNKQAKEHLGKQAAEIAAARYGEGNTGFEVAQTTESIESYDRLQSSNHVQAHGDAGWSPDDI